MKNHLIRLSEKSVGDLRVCELFLEKVESKDLGMWRSTPHALCFHVLGGDFLKDLSTCTKSEGDHLSPKSDISPQKCSLFTRKDHSTTPIAHFHSQT